MKRFHVVTAALLSLSLSNVALAAQPARGGTYVVKSASSSAPRARVSTSTTSAATAAASGTRNDLASQVGRLVEGRALDTIRAPDSFSARSQLTSLTQQVLAQQLGRVPHVGGVLAATAQALVPVIVEQAFDKVQHRVVSSSRTGSPISSTVPVRSGSHMK